MTLPIKSYSNWLVMLTHLGNGRWAIDGTYNGPFFWSPTRAMDIIKDYEPWCRIIMKNSPSESADAAIIDASVNPRMDRYRPSTRSELQYVW